jgi:hypothetical protein
VKRIKLNEPVWDRVVTVNDSSNIVELSFKAKDENVGEMKVSFANGNEYVYLPVKAFDFGILAGSFSIGSTFQKYLKLGIIPVGEKVNNV